VRRSQRIEDNPLPWVLEVTPVDASLLPELAERLGREDGVESVIVDLQWLERLAAMIEVIRQADDAAGPAVCGCRGIRRG
jgi:cell division protein FtsX